MSACATAARPSTSTSVARTHGSHRRERSVGCITLSTRTLPRSAVCVNVRLPESHVLFRGTDHAHHGRRDHPSSRARRPETGLLSSGTTRLQFGPCVGG